MSAETCQAAFFKELLTFLHDQAVEYAILGDVRAYPDFIHSDIDIVISTAIFEGLPSFIHTFCQQSDSEVLQSIIHESKARNFVLAKCEADGRVFLQLDFCSDYVQGGRLLLKAKELLIGHQWDSRGFFTPAPDKGLIYYLLKKIDKGTLNERQWSYLTEAYALDEQGGERQIGIFWPDEQATEILKALGAGDIEFFKERLQAFKRSLGLVRGYTLSSLLLEARRAIERLRRPTGLWVAFLGPDGAGKSTLIEKVRLGVEPAFGRTVTEHLRPSLGRDTRGSAPVTNPHEHPPRNRLASVVKLVYWWFDYTVGYYFKTLPSILRSGLVMYDRYYHDILVDTRRYRYGGSLTLARWIGRFIPKPSFYFVLDAPPEVLQARKQEVSLEETTRQRQAYLKLSRELPNCHVIDVNRSAGESSSEIEGIILDHMERRTARRLGWN